MLKTEPLDLERLDFVIYTWGALVSFICVFGGCLAIQSFCSTPAQTFECSLTNWPCACLVDFLICACILHAAVAARSCSTFSWLGLAVALAGGVRASITWYRQLNNYIGLHVGGEAGQ